jgi:hypothetical protein
MSRGATIKAAPAISNGGLLRVKPAVTAYLREFVNWRVKDRYGSKCEELNVSKSSPLRPTERTSMRRAATSLNGMDRPRSHPIG